jgi:hypothetical protein
MRVNASIADGMLRPARRISWLVAAAWLGLAGCRNSDTLPALKVYEVNGKVLMADDKPLRGGWVYFVPKGDLPVTPSAEIGPDGTFSIVTGGSGQGAPPGEYKVRIEAPQLRAAKKGGKHPFPPKYKDEDSSGLVITVRAEPNQLDPIRLK